MLRRDIGRDPHRAQGDDDVGELRTYTFEALPGGAIEDEQADQEGHAPAPGGEGRVAGGRAHHEEHRVGAHHTDGDAELDEAAVHTAPALGGVLGGQQHRAAPLGADGDALGDTEEDEQDRGGDPDRLVRGEEADPGGGEAHQGQRQHQKAPQPGSGFGITEQARG